MSEFYAIVTPNAFGSWEIEIGGDGHKAGSDALWRRHGVLTQSGAFTRRGAVRRARRLVRRHKKAAARLARPGFRVEE